MSSQTTKILFCASYPNQPIGYSRIAHILANSLASHEDIKVYYFGFSNHPTIADNSRYINEHISMIDVLKEEGLVEGKENFGTTLIEKYLTTLTPDMVFIYNDLIVTCRLINSLIEYKKKSYAHSFKLVSYIDLVYKNERALYLNHLKRHADLVFTFAPSWHQHLLDAGFEASKVRVLPHGINKNAIVKEFPEDSRVDLKLEEEDFIILNTNRNTYRKMWDVTIKAFLLFLKKQNCKKNIKLMINCKIEDPSGYRILELISVVCKEFQLDEQTILTKHIICMTNCGNLSDDQVCRMYNACSVGINTCCGEGFGLCNVEHAYVGAPQVVSAVGPFKDIFNNSMARLIEPVVKIECPTLMDDHNGTLELCRAEDFAEALSFYYENPNIREQHGKRAKERVEKLFDWDTILEQFFRDLAPLIL
jgi:glycosyltransferase involved in cell wall biosynthesis